MSYKFIRQRHLEDSLLIRKPLIKGNVMFVISELYLLPGSCREGMKLIAICLAALFRREKFRRVLGGRDSSSISSSIFVATVNVSKYWCKLYKRLISCKMVHGFQKRHCLEKLSSPFILLLFEIPMTNMKLDKKR